MNAADLPLYDPDERCPKCGWAEHDCRFCSDKVSQDATATFGSLVPWPDVGDHLRVECMNCHYAWPRRPLDSPPPPPPSHRKCECGAEAAVRSQPNINPAPVNKNPAPVWRVECPSCRSTTWVWSSPADAWHDWDYKWHDHEAAKAAFAQPAPHYLTITDGVRVTQTAFPVLAPGESRTYYLRLFDYGGWAVDDA